MEYIIKHNPHAKGKDQKLYDVTGDLILTISEKISAIPGKEVIYNGNDEVVYLVDTLDRKGQFQSTIYDASSREILTVYLSRTYSGLNLYVSSANKKYAVNNKIDMSEIHIYKEGSVAATVSTKKTLFGNSYILDIAPRQDDPFIHLVTMVITKLIEFKSAALLVNNVYAN